MGLVSPCDLQRPGGHSFTTGLAADGSDVSSTLASDSSAVTPVGGDKKPKSHMNTCTNTHTHAHDHLTSMITSNACSSGGIDVAPVSMIA